MYGLIKALYNEKKQREFVSLYTEAEIRDQMLMRATLAEALKDCPRILESHGSDWIFCTLSAFNKSPDDTARIFQGIMRHLDTFTVGILNDRIQYKETNEIADSCLVGLSFFRKYLEAKHKRKAFPSPDYYRKVGSLAFQRLGYETIGEEFNSWIVFIEKEMTDTLD